MSSLAMEFEGGRGVGFSAVEARVRAWFANNKGWLFGRPSTQTNTAAREVAIAEADRRLRTVHTVENDADVLFRAGIEPVSAVGMTAMCDIVRDDLGLPILDEMSAEQLAEY